MDKDIETDNDEFYTTKLCFKCRKCSLEYAVYTNYKDEWENRRPHCPECGFQDERPLLLATHQAKEAVSSIIYNKGIM